MESTAELQQVADAIDRLSMWLRRAVQLGVSTTTITALDSLHVGGPMRVSELAEREALSQPGMTTLVNRLEAAGHAERVADPTDGRAALVRITPAGRAVLTERHRLRAERLQDELERLDPADRAALVAAVPAITRLAAHMTDKERVPA